MQTTALPDQESFCCCLNRTLRELRLRSNQTDAVFGCSHISNTVLGHLACCPQLRRLGISSAELMSVDLGALRHLVHLEVLFSCQKATEVKGHVAAPARPLPS